MTNKQRFFTLMQQGGFTPDEEDMRLVSRDTWEPTDAVFLRVGAWKAVSAALKWRLFQENSTDWAPEYVYNWLQFTQALASGKTVEEALTAIV